MIETSEDFLRVLKLVNESVVNTELEKIHKKIYHKYELGGITRADFFAWLNSMLSFFEHKKKIELMRAKYLCEKIEQLEFFL